jgi:homoserine dehydrogenase
MAPPQLRVGLIGHGTVGAAYATALVTQAERLSTRLPARLRLAQLVVRHPDRHRPAAPGVRLHDDPLALALDPGIDLVVEASGDGAAAAWLRVAIARGAATVTANKLAVATDHELLDALAARHPLLHCEAAVAAAVPIVRALRDSLDGEEIHHIRGVLNGTTTFILGELERGLELAEAVARARDLGITERDGSDLTGRDAAAKLAILATIAWRTPVTVDRVATRGLDTGITDVVRAARGHQSRVRLVAEAWQDGGLCLQVEPRLLAATDPLAAAEGVTNVVEVGAELAGVLYWHGQGAGGTRTASALLGDTLAAARALVEPGAGRHAA